MVKKGVSAIIKPQIRTSVNVSKKTFVRLDDYADEKGISKTKLTNRAFWNIFKRKAGATDLERVFKGDSEYELSVDKIQDKILSKMKLTKQGLSVEMEKELNNIIDSDED